jgi:nuclease S1
LRRIACWLCAASLSLAAAPAAHAWGGTGHKVIAKVAEARLSARARSEVRWLLRSGHMGRSLPAISSWADWIRDRRPETKRWHYVDIPRRATSYVPSRDCKQTPEGDCVVAATERWIAVLSDAKRSRAARREALAFVVHFVGDLHQPLHCADDHDHGGNEVEVRFFAWPSNLHRVWDSALIDHTGLDVDTYARRLGEWLARQDTARLQAGGPADWAIESHDVAVAHVYPLPADHRIGEAYYQANRPVLDAQLAKAGLRLAAVLEQALGR